MFEALKAENVRKIKAYTVGENDGYVSFYPRFIQLEHTTFCNADCVMCNHFFLGNKGAKHLPEEIVRLLEPVFPHCQMMMLNGDGEPFLHPELPKQSVEHERPPKELWQKFYENGEYVRHASHEVGSEENYNHIDGVNNNRKPQQPIWVDPKKRPSVRKRLQEKLSQVHGGKDKQRTREKA